MRSINLAIVSISITMMGFVACSKKKSGDDAHGLNASQLIGFWKPEKLITKTGEKEEVYEYSETGEEANFDMFLLEDTNLLHRVSSRGVADEECDVDRQWRTDGDRLISEENEVCHGGSITLKNQEDDHFDIYESLQIENETVERRFRYKRIDESEMLAIFALHGATSDEAPESISGYFPARNQITRILVQRFGDDLKMGEGYNQGALIGIDGDLPMQKVETFSWDSSKIYLQDGRVVASSDLSEQAGETHCVITLATDQQYGDQIFSGVSLRVESANSGVLERISDESPNYAWFIFTFDESQTGVSSLKCVRYGEEAIRLSDFKAAVQGFLSLVAD